MQTIDMNTIVGRAHILFLCLDALRYDVAYEQQEQGKTPVLNRYGVWRKCQAPGNFTLPSHQAMFAGFLPIDEGICNMKERETLFFSEDIGMGRKAPKGAYTFHGRTWIESLAQEGYRTYCIGGVSFFDKRTEVGKIMPSYFQYSDWNPSFGCRVKEAPKHQVDFAIRRLETVPDGHYIMMYINIAALHYPNYFYLPQGQADGRPYQTQEQTDSRLYLPQGQTDGRPYLPQGRMVSGPYKPGEQTDSKQAHAAALRYVDAQLARLFEAFKRRGRTFVICCSDHGTCYGEDGVWYHGLNHPIINTVPYKHFML